MGNEISENVIYFCYYKTKSLQNVQYMFGVVGETHARDYFKAISFYNSKDITFSDMSLLVCNVMCVKLHIKETEILQKRSKGIKK